MTKQMQSLQKTVLSSNERISSCHNRIMMKQSNIFCAKNDETADLNIDRIKKKSSKRYICGRDSTEVERPLRNLILDYFARSRVQTPLEAKRIEKSIRVSRVLIFSFAGKTKA